MRECYLCHVAEELRPYGVGGQDICLACALKPENFEEMQRQITLHFEAAMRVSRVIVIDEEHGIYPLGGKPDA